MNKLFFLFLSISLSLNLSAQIIVDNGSFEDEPSDATMPSGWLSCNLGTTPDILPGFWQVYNEPSEGDSYIGLITRPDRSWESIGQRLRQPIESGACYEMNVDLAHSKTYTGYDNPLKFRIWGSRSRCDRTQLLWESDLIEHEEWERYKFEFDAKGTYNYIILEAFFPDGKPSKYKGNVLIDNLSDIVKCKRA